MGDEGSERLAAQLDECMASEVGEAETSNKQHRRKVQIEHIQDTNISELQPQKVLKRSERPANTTISSANDTNDDTQAG